MRDRIVLTSLCASLGAMSLGAALLGCSSTPPGLSAVPIPERTATGIRPGLALAAITPVAVDPELEGFDGWPLVFSVVAAPAETTCTIDILRDDTVITSLPGTVGASSCEATWNARGAGDTRLADGEVTVRATLSSASGVLATRDATLALVRVGVTGIDLGGAPGARQPLLYRATNGRRDGFYELRTTRAPFAMGPDSTEIGGTPLARADGSPRPIPTIWSDLLSPPLDRGASDGVNASYYSVPSAYVVGSELAITAHTSTSDAIPSEIELRLVAPEGVEIEGDDVVRDEGTILMASLGSPITAVDRYDLEYAFSFEVRPAGGDWQPMPGTFTVPLRIYGLAGAPTFGFTTMPHRTWVDVIDRITGWIDGAATTPTETAALLVEHVYEDTDLRYDTASGASFYTQYAGSGFSGAVFYMQEFEERANGRIINCSDAASILSTYGSMAGVDMRYHILTSRFGLSAGFDLNYIRAIGMPSFDDTPFDSGRGGFRYHAIVGTTDGLSWDATLALDGDADPASPPFEELMAEALAPGRYLAALSSEAADIRTDHDDKVRIE